LERIGIEGRGPAASRGIVKSDKLEIERFHQFKTKIRNFKSAGAATLHGQSALGFEISDFGFELMESFAFEISNFPAARRR
jgi:hypothetical protein